MYQQQLLNHDPLHTGQIITTTKLENPETITKEQSKWKTNFNMAYIGEGIM